MRKFTENNFDKNLQIRGNRKCFFREYCEFIEALYIVYYSKMSNNDKNINYRKIKESYDDGEDNSDFDEYIMKYDTGSLYSKRE